jgi:3'-5' exoribonuclease
MQHCLEMIRFCSTACDLYPELDRDLLVAGALLHDIGKLEELEVTSRIKGTQKGQLVGHIALGLVTVSKKMEEFGFEEDLKNKVLHLIVSHHGHLEYGSLKEPMFPEAVVLHYADELSSKTTEMLEFIKDGKASTEDEFMYSKRNERNIFLK